MEGYGPAERTDATALDPHGRHAGHSAPPHGPPKAITPGSASAKPAYRMTAFVVPSGMNAITRPA
jgi:hypothetical protein